MAKLASRSLTHPGCAGINLPFYNLGMISQLTAIDISEGMLDEARAKAKMMAISGVIDLVQGNVQKLPFEDNTFDSVVDTFSLCVYPDPVQALKEMARVAKPGVLMPWCLSTRMMWGGHVARTKVLLIHRRCSSHTVASIA
jgi:ubiquinone/menaquinone biosynthesis C-methylase UbiE